MYRVERQLSRTSSPEGLSRLFLVLAVFFATNQTLAEESAVGRATPSKLLVLSANQVNPWVNLIDAEDGKAVPQSPDGKVEQGLKIPKSQLAWQIARQSVFVAAAQELKLPVRDLLAGEVSSEGETAIEMEVFGSNRKESKGPVNVVSLRVPALKASWKTTVPPFKTPFDYRAFVEHFEAQSRGELPAFLKKRVVKNATPPVNGKAPSPESTPEKPSAADSSWEEVDELLNDLTFICQFQSLRWLHARLHQGPETEELLGRIVRNYAHLGVLTEHYMHPMHNVFKARSLLYAQRMVAKFPDAPLSLPHRAYAFGLCGLHSDALSDLKAAGKAAPGLPWLKWLEAYCRCDRMALAEWAQPEDCDPLVVWLWFLATELEGSAFITAECGVAAAEKLSQPYRIFDSLCDLNQISLSHNTTTLPLPMLMRSIYTEIAALQGLPEASRKVLADPAGNFLPLEKNPAQEFPVRRRVIDALKSSAAEKVAGMPSWGLLGAMIEEESFKQLIHRVRFMSHTWSVDPDGWLAAADPLTQDHRYAAILNTYAWDQPRYAAAWKQLQSSEFEPAWGLYQERVWPRGTGNHPFYKDHVLSGLDDTANELRRHVVDHPKLLDRYAEISPQSPVVLAMVMDHAKAADETQWAAWDRAAVGHPRVLRSLSEEYLKANRFDDAVRCAKAAAKLEPSYDSYYFLARLFKEPAQDAEWVQTWDEFLQHPGFGLEHAQVQVMLSQHFRKRREWKRAEPYANAAATSYAAWAMLEAAVVYEGLEDWEKAEELYQAKAIRYRQGAWSWYFFCRRTGQGNVESALDMVQPLLQVMAAEPAGKAGILLTHYFVLEGDTQAALKNAEKVFERTPWGVYGLSLAMLQDQVGQKENRDATLTKVHEAWKLVDPNVRSGSRLLALADAIAEDLSAAEKENGKAGFAKLGEQGLNAVAAGADPSEQVVFDYFAGCYCDQHGNRELATKLWNRCLTYEDYQDPFRTLAVVALRKLGDAAQSDDAPTKRADSEQ